MRFTQLAVVIWRDSPNPGIFTSLHEAVTKIAHLFMNLLEWIPTLVQFSHASDLEELMFEPDDV